MSTYVAGLNYSDISISLVQCTSAENILLHLQEPAFGICSAQCTAENVTHAPKKKTQFTALCQ